MKHRNLLKDFDDLISLIVFRHANTVFNQKPRVTSIRKHRNKEGNAKDAHLSLILLAENYRQVLHPTCGQITLSR